MASIPADVILIWTGTHASIPTGWSRETTLDDKFAKAWGDEDPDDTGGATTHTHTSTAHSHTLAAHTHTYTTSTLTPDPISSGGSGLIRAHSHTGTSGAASGGTTSSDALTYLAYSNDPPYRKVIFIKSSGGSLATNIVALYNSNTPPSNWDNVTELSGRFMKGASDGADADLSTDNGSSTNSHDLTHTHTPSSHTHTAANCNAASASQSASGSLGSLVAYTHVHSVSFSAQTEAINEYASSPEQAETVEPAYAILQAIKKGASGVKTKGIIGLWLGTEASIPAGWILCDGNNDTKDLRNKFIKIGDPAGANGGSNTHTHAAYAHSHTGAGHTHSGTVSAHVNTTPRSSAPQDTQAVEAASGTHTVTSNSTTAGTAEADTTADSSSNEPEYRTAVYIEFQKEIGGGAFIFNML